MDDEPDRVEATEHQEEVARLFERYNLVSAAVVDECRPARRRHDGRRHRRRARRRGRRRHQAARRRRTRTKSSPIRSSTPSAAAFPGSSSICAPRFLAASVIRLFEESLEQMVALAILMPIVASMGGNAGTQTMTVAVRALATRELGRAQRLAHHPPRGGGRPPQRAGLRRHPGQPRRPAGSAVAAARHRHRPCPRDGPGLRGARRDLRAA